jgi:hypothetical protein
MRYVATVAFEGRTMDDYWRFRQGYAGEPIDGLIVQVGGAASSPNACTRYSRPVTRAA